VNLASTHSSDGREAGGPASGAGALEEAPFVIAVVLNWNNLPDTLECVDSVLRSDFSNLAVRVVDNGSREDPSAVLHERYPDVEVVRNPRNLGYGGGNNLGLKCAIDEGAVYVLLLNNDVVVASDCVRRLVAAAEADSRIGMATPKVFYYDRPTDVYWEGGIVDWKSGELPHDSRGLPVEGGIVQSEWLTGCSLLVRAATIREVGLLDERYFLYFEDADWSVRAARRGWTNAVVLEAHAWHKLSRSTGGWMNPAVRFYHFRNRYRFVTAHGPSLGRLRWKLGYVWKMCSAYRSVGHEPENRQVILAAVVNLVLARSGPYEATGTGRRLVVGLDALLVLLMKSARTLKRFVPRIRRLGRRQGGRGGGLRE
jgi:GT2 family glycosyltransferase